MWPLGTGRGKETIVPPESPEGIQSCQDLDFNPVIVFGISDLQNCKKINVCWFVPPSSQCLLTAQEQQGIPLKPFSPLPISLQISILKLFPSFFSPKLKVSELTPTFRKDPPGPQVGNLCRHPCSLVVFALLN